LWQYYANNNTERDKLNFTDSPIENAQPSTTSVEQPTDLNLSTEFPVPHLTDSIIPFSDFTTLLPFLSENKTLEFDGATAFNSTLPRLLDTHTAIYVYTVFILGSVFITSIRSMFFFKVCMTASKILHDTMFGSILAATMRFFDTNPSGKHHINYCMVTQYILVLN
jgi:hypothetical protein